MKKIASLIFMMTICMVFAATSFAAQILIKGKVTDSYTGSPVGVTMKFETKAGQTIKIKSDPVTGAFTQLFESDTEYEVTFLHKEIIRKVETFKTESATGYKEFEKNFSVQKLTKDLLFLDADIFDKGTSSINSGFDAQLEEIVSIMKFNRNVNFYFVVSLNDIAEKERASKAALLEERKSKLQEKVNNIGRDAGRIEVKSESSCKKSNSNLAVIVKSIESVLK